MLRIRTLVKPSQIHGLGLFTLEPIKKGQCIWLFDEGLDIKITIEAYEKLPLIIKEHFNTYAYKEKGHYILSIDNDKYFNHSKTPNIDENCFAIRNVEIGEELTCDYSLFDEDSMV